MNNKEIGVFFPGGLHFWKFKENQLKSMVEYNINLPITAPIILDIGANIGVFSRWASKKWTDATIYAYEPIRDNFNVLIKTVEGLNVIPLNVAVRENGGTDVMYLGKNNCGEASFFDLGEQADETEKVKVMDAALLPRADIIKIDTEGCELEILKEIDLSGAKAIMVELHRKGDLILALSLLHEFNLVSCIMVFLERWVVKFIRGSVIYKGF